MFKKIVVGVVFVVLQIILVLIPNSSFAIDPEKPCWGAEYDAAQRALGAYEPDEKVRNPDYLAEKFVSPEFWESSAVALEDMRKQSWRLLRLSDYYYRKTAQTKHIDAILKNEGTKGIKQVVNMGVGYDTRSYRFHDALSDVKFFEMDTPAMIRRKKDIVAKIFGSLPKHVVFIAIDFEKQSLEDALIKAGYDKTKKTLFIWEGVTMLLTEEAVDGTLKFIAEQSAPGSSVVFNYLSKSFIDGDSLSLMERGIKKYLADIGEPYIYGIDPGKIRDFLKDRGFELISEIGPDEMEKMYLIRSDGSVYGTAGNTNQYRIVHAVITKK